MVRALTHENTRHLMEEEGIGFDFRAARAGAGPDHLEDAGKNEVAIESLELSHEKLQAGARGIIAILIGL